MVTKIIRTLGLIFNGFLLSIYILNIHTLLKLKAKCYIIGNYVSHEDNVCA